MQFRQYISKLRPFWWPAITKCLKPRLAGAERGKPPEPELTPNITPITNTMTEKSGQVQMKGDVKVGQERNPFF